jgi:SAM-dependent methyltransferase
MALLEPTPPLAVDDVVSLAAPAGKRVLDLGCGDGALGAALLAKGAAEVVGLDACARGLTRSRLTAVFRLSPDGAPELPYPDRYFDLLVVEDLSALAAPAPTLTHLRRWLADEGRVVVVAHNATHEAALVSLLGEGRWPAAAGARPMAVEAALAAIKAAGLVLEEEMIAVRTEPSQAAAVLQQLAEALGAPGPRVADGLTLVRAILAARPADRAGAGAAALPDPWSGSRPVKVLLAPDLEAAADGWLQALEGLARGLSGNAGVTLGVALPLPLLSDPPAALKAAVEGAEVDLLLTEAPADAAGWARLLAGASTWVVTGARPDLTATARWVGVDLEQGA